MLRQIIDKIPRIITNLCVGLGLLQRLSVPPLTRRTRCIFRECSDDVAVRRTLGATRLLEWRAVVSVGLGSRIGVRRAEIKEEAADVAGWGSI